VAADLIGKVVAVPLEDDRHAASLPAIVRARVD
jgi:hypothetical protein